MAHGRTFELKRSRGLAKGTMFLLGHESSGMKTNIIKSGAMVLAFGLCVWSAELRAQDTTTVTTTKGAFTEFVPGSETVVIRSETNPTPLRYVVTKQTTIVDQSGAPIAIDQVRAGSPLSVEYTGTGDRLVASRIVVQRAPVATEQHTSTTTTTTRTLTHDEKEALEERREHRKERAEEQIEKQKEALDKAKEKLEDDDDGD
jgi:hypothetical protein